MAWPSWYFFHKCLVHVCVSLNRPGQDVKKAWPSWFVLLVSGMRAILWIVFGKTLYVTSSSLHLCHHSTCVHFRRALESQVKRCLHVCHHIGLHRLPTAHTAHIGRGAEILLPSLIHGQRIVRIVQQHNELACLRQ